MVINQSGGPYVDRFSSEISVSQYERRRIRHDCVTFRDLLRRSSDGLILDTPSLSWAGRLLDRFGIGVALCRVSMSVYNRRMRAMFPRSPLGNMAMLDRARGKDVVRSLVPMTRLASAVHIMSKQVTAASIVISTGIANRSPKSITALPAFQLS